MGGGNEEEKEDEEQEEHGHEEEELRWYHGLSRFLPSLFALCKRSHPRVKIEKNTFCSMSMQARRLFKIEKQNCFFP